VRTHVQNILRALNVDSAAAAVALARRSGQPVTERSGDDPRRSAPVRSRRHDGSGT